MKKARLLAWLLIVAVLSLTCPAFGDGLDVELPDEVALDLSDGLSMDVDGIEIDAGMEADGLSDQLPAIDIPDLNLSGDMVEVPLESAQANALADGQSAGSLLPPGNFNNEALFSGYVDMLFGKGVRKNGYAGDRLTGNTKRIFNYLQTQVTKVAAGTITSTVFRIPASYTPDFSWDTYYDSVVAVFHALLADCPYHLYWFDKTVGVALNYEDQMILSFAVASEFASSRYKTNAQKIKATQKAVTNAKNLVSQNAGKSDYVKLCCYRNYIFKSVKYNYDAVYDPNTPYGNPWQLIWAFDGDSSTNIVCEGYSKAFKYLCDLSSFKDDIRCYLITGDAGGPHMWNIVTMGDGWNYHVDLTNMDGGNSLNMAFLSGAKAVDSYRAYRVADAITYTLDAETLATFPSKVLKVATQNFNPSAPKPTKVAISQGTTATLYMGNTMTLKAQLTPANAGTTLTWTSSDKNVATVTQRGVVTPKSAGTAKITVKTVNNLSASITITVKDATSIKLKKGTTVLKRGATINLKQGSALTLTAVVVPSQVKTTLTWSRSNTNVTLSNGKVRAPATAEVGVKTKITVKTANGKSTYVYVKVIQ